MTIPVRIKYAFSINMSLQRKVGPCFLGCLSNVPVSHLKSGTISHSGTPIGVGNRFLPILQPGERLASHPQLDGAEPNLLRSRRLAPFMALPPCSRRLAPFMVCPPVHGGLPRSCGVAFLFTMACPRAPLLTAAGVLLRRSCLPRQRFKPRPLIA